MNNPFALRNTGETEPVQETTLFSGEGIYYDLSNEDYHSGKGISKSGLDLIAQSPSVYLWNKKAPRNEDKTKALDMGTALHCILLEPEEYSKRFIVSPVFNRRTNEGKEQEAQFLMECADRDCIIINEDEDRQIKLMRDSAMAHPVAKYIFDAEGFNESSIFWTDSETGELCKIRPDRVIKVNGRYTLVDVKKIDNIDRFKRHVFDFRYHVQAAMYREGFEAKFGQLPDFWFLVVSSSVSAGRYPVNVFNLPSDVLMEGYAKFRENLQTYSVCKQQDDWLHISSI